MVNSGGWMPSLRQGDVVREAHYSGGIVLDPQHPDQLYLSRDIYGKFEMEHRVFQAENHWESELLTNNSHENNVRPYVVYGSPADRIFLMWMRGNYRHYTEFDTQIILWSNK